QALAASTTEAAVALATGKAVAALASPHAIALARGLAQATLSVKVKAVGVALLAAVLAGFGGAAVQQDHGTAAPPAPPQPHGARRRQGARKGNAEGPAGGQARSAEAAGRAGSPRRG